MIKMNYLRPMLWTNQLKESVDFYVNVLGFTCEEFNEEWQWASLINEGVSIMLAKPNEHMVFEMPIFTGSLYFNVNNVEQLWNKLKDSCQVCYELEIFPWEMKEFAIYDNNGYLLQFGENLI